MERTLDLILDEEADAAYIYINRHEFTYTREFDSSKHTVNVDFSEDNQIIGIELLTIDRYLNGKRMPVVVNYQERGKLRKYRMKSKGIRINSDLKEDKGSIFLDENQDICYGERLIPEKNNQNISLIFYYSKDDKLVRIDIQ